jgi:diaminopimelate decarboxylase
MRLSALAGTYGTPALILDEADVRYRCRSYAAALPGTEIAYAGKAFLCRAMAQWIAAEGLSLAVCSAGELAVAQSVNFPAERIVLQGNTTPADLRAALRYGVDRTVVDSTAEILRLAALTPRPQRVLVQVTPDVHAPADRAAAAAEDQRSGFSLRSGAAADAVRRVLSHPELDGARLPPCRAAARDRREERRVTRPDPQGNDQ